MAEEGESTTLFLGETLTPAAVLCYYGSHSLQMFNSSLNSDSPRSVHRVSIPWVHALLIATATASLLWSTWLTWPDAIVDFGRELYVPWQILEGKVPYREMALFNGPLSPYMNALWMALFGVSFRTLIIFNVAIVVLVLFLIYRLVAETVDSTAALLGCLTFVSLFAFSQYIVVGNYNWIAPYSHEMTHGIALALVALFFLKRFLEYRSSPYALLSGLLVGLVFLTKVEIALAAGIAVAGGFALGLLSISGHEKAPAKLIALFSLGVILPAVASVLLLSMAMPLQAALIGTMGSSIYIFDSQHSALPFFAAGTGFRNIGAGIASQLRWSVAYGLLFVPLATLALKWNSGRSIRRWLVALCGFELVAALWLSLPHFRQFAQAPKGFALLAGLSSALHLKQFARPWPLLLCGLLVISLVRLRNRWDDQRQGAEQIFKVCSITFALLLLLKMLLNTRIGHYGFGLALPAAVVLVAVLGGTLSQWIATRGGNGSLFRASFVAIWGLVVLLHVGVSTVRISTKRVQVGRGSDAYLADARGHVINEAVDQIRQQVEPRQSLTVMPDGEMLGYLSRRANRSRFGNFIPATIVLFEEQTMLDDLRAAAPDFIALVHKDTSEYGPRFFGQDYATAIFSWIQETYEPIQLAGSAPFQDDTQFGVLLLRHRKLKNPSGSSSNTQSPQ